MTESIGVEDIQRIFSESDLDASLLAELVQPSSQLQSLSPERGVEQYLEHKRTEIRPQTVSEYERKLEHFLDFCRTHRIDDLNDLDGRSVDNYLKYRRTESSEQSTPLKPKTMRDEAYLFQSFLDYLESIDAVTADLSDSVNIPDLGPDDGVRNIEISSKRVEQILEHLEQYEYATRVHVIWLYHAHTGRRPGSLYGLDLDDLHLDQEEPYLEIRHRPGETELKKGIAGETELSISRNVAQVFQDYLEQNRIDSVTDNGREPFLTSRYGRLSKSTMRRYVYQYSRPCTITGECPHDRDPSECEAAEPADVASKCPSSHPPYALRHGYISDKRREGVPKEIISDRCDVDPETIEKHYDERDASEKRKLRRQVLTEIRGREKGGGYL